MENSNEENSKAEENAYNNAMLGAWLNTKLERDKQLLSLSSTAIGLLVTLLRTTGVSDNNELVLFSLALLAFVLTVISALWILQANASHIENVLVGSETESKILSVLDRFSITTFVIGLILAGIIGVESASMKLNNKEVATSMSQDPSMNTHHQGVKHDDSWNGVAKLRPQPQPPSPTQSTTSSTPPPSSSGNSNSGGSNNSSESGNGS